MRILMINVVCGIRSTGRICTDIAKALEAKGHEVKIAYGREKVPEDCRKYAVRIGCGFDVISHALKARLFDASGFGSRKATERFIEWVNDYNPDVIHIHNIHGYYINIEVLFNYLKTCGKRIIWTMHDCWAFTGHAAFCEAADCTRWISGCGSCPKKNDYPKSLIDNSKKNWLKKKALFESMPDLTIVVPSKWLAGLVADSFLSRFKVVVINNGIDASVFKPTESDIKQKLGIEDKKIVLGVAALWEQRKGLFDFIELSKKLDSEYKIVLVGLSAKQKTQLPKNIIGIERTNSVRELVELYSAADVFVNPTYEDNYPTTNLEAIACGTQVITYRTGGSPESVKMKGGFVVARGDVDAIVRSIITSFKDINSNNESFDIDRIIMVGKYVDLYS